MKFIYGLIIIICLLSSAYRLDNRPRIELNKKTYEVIRVWDKYTTASGNIFIELAEIYS